MTSGDLPGEDAFIRSITGCLPPLRHTRLGIGDDAAVLADAGDDLLLITTDLLVEDTHFRLAWGDLPALGWKALAQNLSDIAAMGGTPTHAVIALGLPPSLSPAQALELYRGMAPLASDSGTEIIGGDTNRAAHLTLALTVLGRVAPDELLTRAGARPGEALFVTGALGLAAAGLRLLECGEPAPEALTPVVQAQLRPHPRLAAGRALATSRQVTALMDLSDGVGTDLHRFCRASGVGAVVDAAALPQAPLLADACRWLHAHGHPCAPLDLALYGGEDFELLFSAPPAAESALRARLAPLPVTRIGTLCDSPDLLLRSGTTLAPLAWGFTHF